MSSVRRVFEAGLFVCRESYCFSYISLFVRGNTTIRPSSAWFLWYGAFSYDVTVAILVFQNKETEAILVYQTNPPGIELYFYETFTLFQKNNMAADHVSENALHMMRIIAG